MGMIESCRAGTRFKVVPLWSGVALDKSFNLSVERDRVCQISYYLATSFHGILNSRRQVPKEQRGGIQTRVPVVVPPLVCTTLSTSFHPFRLVFCISP